ncbi:MAG TPA: MFS transporter [Steroidobacteraceae bacterium]|nr:MFS transporter [Steroidobacteraceae bacterium]
MTGSLSSPGTATAPGTAPGRVAWRTFAICLIGWTLTNMDQSLLGYAIPGIVLDFGIGLGAVGNMLAISFLFAAVAVVVIGMLADRYGRRALFVICLASSAAFVGLHALAEDITTLTVLRALGFGLSAGLAPITNTFVVETAPTRWRGVMAGLLQCGYPLGWFVASLFAAPMLASYSWRTMFLFAFAVVPLAFVLGRLLPESERFANQVQTPKAALSWRESLAQLFAPGMRRTTIVCFLAFFCHGGAYAGTAFYFPSFYTSVRGYTEAEATTLVGLAYGIGVVGYVTAAFVGEFVTTRRNTIVLWCWIGAAALLGLIWLPTSYLADVFWFSLMATFFYGSAAVMGVYVAELFPTHLRATGAALSGSAALACGFAIFPVLVAALVERYGWQTTFTLAVVPPLVAVGFLALALKNLRSGLDVDELDATGLESAGQYGSR